MRVAYLSEGEASELARLLRAGVGVRVAVDDDGVRVAAGGGVWSVGVGWVEGWPAVAADDSAHDDAVALSVEMHEAAPWPGDL